MNYPHGALDGYPEMPTGYPTVYDYGQQMSGISYIPEMSSLSYTTSMATGIPRVDAIDDLMDTSDNYFSASPSSTATDDPTFSSYLYGGRGAETICAAADSSSQTPPEAGRPSKKKLRNPDAQHRQRRAANERERRRMKSINKAFDLLRGRVPTLPYEKRLSKVDTLRLTIGYIALLKEMLNTDDALRAGVGDGVHLQLSRNQMGSLARLGDPQAQKVIIDCHADSFQGAHCGFGDQGFYPPLRGHSLSWRKSQAEVFGNATTLCAKIWMPQSAQPVSESGATNSSPPPTSIDSSSTDKQ